jgi:hypothetical protein
MSTPKLVREFRRKAKLAGYVITAIETKPPGHLYATVDHGNGIHQRLSLPSSPASYEHSVKHALDEIRRFRTAHEETTKHELHLHGQGGREDAHPQEANQPRLQAAESPPDGRPIRRRRRAA